MKNQTFDIFFNDGHNANCKGFEKSEQYCREYIVMNNGTDSSYFADYIGGMVSIRCNETGETIFETEILKP